MIISSGQKLQSLNDYTIKIYKDGVQLNETTHSKSIGLTDDNLSWKAHQHDISKKKKSHQCLRRLFFHLVIWNVTLFANSNLIIT